KLAKALEKVIEAHPFVKLRIKEDADGNPMMVPQDYAYRQTIEKLSQEAFDRLVPELIQPFRLTEDPLFRIRIFETEERRYLFMDFHHIIYDGTSMLICLKELNGAYRDEEIVSEEWTGFDVALEEAEVRKTEVYNESKSWYERIFGGLEIDSLPVRDRHADEVAFASWDHPLDLSVEAMNRFCEKTGISANVLNTAAFGKLLGTFVNANEALFATIYNGRTGSKEERTIDMMVKTLPVYCKWTSDTGTTQYLKEMQDQILGAMQNDIYSFSELAASSGINSDILFAYQGDYLAKESLLGGMAEEIALGGNATGMPLDFQVFIKEGKLVLHVEYMANRYSEGFIKEMSESYA
ncbi:MAG: hypothetical protein K2H62_06325, partial [Bacteroidales bacterium]|nr:hypothetical protein [Bacteroidales bacterium]